jgi:hypothetical protein
MSALAICLSFTLVGTVASVLAISNTGGPVITLSYGLFQGNATGNLVEFLLVGMPYAAPPYASSSIFVSDDILINTCLKAFDFLLLHYL